MSSKTAVLPTESYGPRPVTRRRPATTLTGRSEDDDAGAQAIRALNEPHYTESRPAFDPFDAIAKTREAQDAREKGERLLQPTSADGAHLVAAAGEALVLVPDRPITGLSPEQRAIEIALIDTLETPTMIGLGASQLRQEAAARIGILQPALDAAETAQASNSNREDALSPARGGPLRRDEPVRPCDRSQ